MGSSRGARADIGRSVAGRSLLAATIALLVAFLVAPSASAEPAGHRPGVAVRAVHPSVDVAHQRLASHPPLQVRVGHSPASRHADDGDTRTGLATAARPAGGLVAPAGSGSWPGAFARGSSAPRAPPVPVIP